MDSYSIIELFVEVDDFCHENKTRLKKLKSTSPKRTRKSRLSLSEKVTISLLYHISGYKNFKFFYHEKVLKDLQTYFPDAISYTRFIDSQEEIIYTLYLFMKNLVHKKSRLINFVDSTSLKVCHNKRIHNHKVFQGVAERGKTSVGWFYGMKLHLIINDLGELVDVSLTRGNVDDRAGVKSMKEVLFGNLFGDKGYVSKDLEEIFRKVGINYKTKKKKNMKRKTEFIDKIFLAKRGLVESVIGILKCVFDLEHSRHRSFKGFLRHTISALIMYQLKQEKPKMKWEFPFIGQYQEEGIAIV